MAAQREYRKTGRFNHESVIMIQDDLTQIPYYAVSNTLSETAMVFRSLFEVDPGALIFIRIDDYGSNRNPIPARVVWCKELKSQEGFRYKVGVEFLPKKNPAVSKASLAVLYRKTPSPIDAREGAA
jgi:hypothetical protein